MLWDYSSSILFLDTVPEGVNFPTLRIIILSIKSTKFLAISLFHSVNGMWNKMRYWRGACVFTYALYCRRGRANDEQPLNIPTLPIRL